MRANERGGIIAISNHKGGVGKTTSVINIGVAFHKRGKVLLVDMDPQANLSQSLGFSNVEEGNTYTALRGKDKLKPLEVFPGVDIVPSTLDLSGAEVELSAEPGREFLLKEALEPLRDQYNLIIIDCPPSLGLLTINCLCAADRVYVPVQAEFLAVQGLTKLVQIVDKIKARVNPGLELGGVFITHYDKRKSLNREVLENLKKHLGPLLMKTFIRDTVALAEAPAHKLDIFRYNPRSYGADDYYSLMEEIITI